MVTMDEYLLRILQTAGPIMRDEISEHWNIPRTTIYGYFKKFLKQGKITYQDVHVKGKGRPKRFWRVVD